MARETPLPVTQPLGAQTPPLLRRVATAFARAVQSFWRHGDLFSGAAISFYALFSLLPLAILLVLVIGLAFPHARVERVIARLFGATAQPDILVQTVQGAYAHRQSLGWLGSLTLVFAATGVFAAVQVALDRVWECHARFFPIKLAVGVLMMVGSLLIFLGALVGTVFAFRFMRESGIDTILGIASAPGHGQRRTLAVAPALAQFGIFWIGYRLLPNAPVRWRDAWPGAVLATVLWQVTSYLLGWYVGKFADYNTLYESLGVVVALAAWLYALACTFLFGAEFVAQWAPALPVTRRPRGRGQA